MWKIRMVCLYLALMTALTACAGKSSQMAQNEQHESRKLQVVTTLFPYYDFVRQIAGDRVDLALVLPAGMDSHSFEPTPADMQTIQNADLLICNGGMMEHWVSEVLEAMDTSEMTLLTMMDYVDVLDEELVEGMEDDDHEHHGFKIEIQYDEHIWTSPVNAMKLTAVIRDVLMKEDPQHADEYEERSAGYLAKLQQIDDGFRQVCADRQRNMIMVGDKFPFRYLAKEYELDYRAAFSGCSTDTEPSAKTIAYLIDKIREENIPVIYYLELSSHQVADLIGQETGAQPLLLHSCHNITRAQLDEGITYEALMQQNIENLKRGLGQ